jgi:hypothetical protein
VELALKAQNSTTPALAGLVAAGVAIMEKAPEHSLVGDIPAPESIVSDVSDAPFTVLQEPDKPVENQNYDRKRLAMSGSADAIKEAYKKDDRRVGSFRTVMPPAVERNLNGSKIMPKLGLEPASRTDMLQTQGISNNEAAPLEFIVKLKDRELSNQLRNQFAKAPAEAGRRLRTALGGGRLVQRARLQGFTMGGEAILSFDGPADIDDFAKVQPLGYRMPSKITRLT